MIFSASAVLLALAVTGAPSATGAAPVARDAAQRPTIREAIVQTAPLERWRTDTPQSRPAALPLMYATLGALQAADVYSTRRALGANAYEANPLMRNASKNAGTMLAVKALSTAASIYFAERAWKKNRKGAVVLMAVLNGVTAAVAARNLKNAR